MAHLEVNGRRRHALRAAAPIEVSSGEVERHRLSRAGNCELNGALHDAAMSHKRTDEAGITYDGQKLADGKGKRAHCDA